MPTKVKTIDEYLAGVADDRRRALQALRATIHALLPKAEECISYSMPAFRYEGHVVAGFLATAKGCSYFPFSGTTLATLSAELRAYDRTKSALHFAPERPLPKTLVKQLLLARIAETGTARKKTPTRPAAKSGRPRGRARGPAVARPKRRLK